jgi:hypothetical protein
MIETKLSQCPVCDAPIDAATSIDGTDITPQVEDVSICLYCTSYLQYDEELIPQEMSIDVLLELPDEVRLQLHRIRKGIKEIQAERGK